MWICIGVWVTFHVVSGGGYSPPNILALAAPLTTVLLYYSIYYTMLYIYAIGTLIKIIISFTNSKVLVCFAYNYYNHKLPF